MPKKEIDLGFRWYEDVADRARSIRDNVYTEHLAYGAALGAEFYAWERFAQTSFNAILNNNHEVSNLGVVALALATAHISQWIRRETKRNIEELGEISTQTYIKRIRTFLTDITSE